VKWHGAAGRVGAGAGTVQTPITKHDALEGRRIQNLALQGRDSADGNGARTLGTGIERIVLAMGLRPGRIGPGNALGHEPTGLGVESRGHEVARALVADPGVAVDRRRHPAGIEARRKVRELMDDDVGTGRRHGAGERCGIEYVDDDRLDPGRFERAGTLGGARRAEDPMPRRQQRHQPAPDSARRAGKKDRVRHDRCSQILPSEVAKTA